MILKDKMITDRAVLIFDLGNVLVRLNPVTGFWPQIMPGSKEAQEKEKIWGNSAAVRAFETGEINDYYTFFQKVKTELDIAVPWNQFQKVYENIIGEPYPETIPLLRQLAGRYKLLLLSNTSPVHWKRCRDDQGLSEYFACCFLSYEAGSMKPEASIYRNVLNFVQSTRQDLIYFDDRRENVMAGTKLGFHACQTRGGVELAENLKRLGIIDNYPYSGP